VNSDDHRAAQLDNACIDLRDAGEAMRVEIPHETTEIKIREREQEEGQ
jgi:hypothetical protein